MFPRLFWGLLTIGAALFLLDEEKPTSKPIVPPANEPPKVDEKPTPAELRKVMRHLGKRSGKVRGGKL